MELTCRKCGSTFRAAVAVPLLAAVRVACPGCGTQMVLKPRTASGMHPVAEPEPPPPTPLPRRKVAAIADEPRPFRQFLGEHLRRLGFDVTYFEAGEPALDFVRGTRAELAILNVYLRGKLGVEVTEDIRADSALDHTRVILIGALFRANRFRANPTNLYGADEYIEEQIPEVEFRQIIRRLFPEIGATAEAPVEPVEYDEARRLARLILSDIVIYHAPLVEQGIRENRFFELLSHEIKEGQQYYDSRVLQRVRREADLFTETLQLFVRMKREELANEREENRRRKAKG